MQDHIVYPGAGGLFVDDGVGQLGRVGGSLAVVGARVLVFVFVRIVFW